MINIMPFFGGRRQVGTTYYTSFTWVAPMTTYRLEALAGVGQAGTPAGSTNSSISVGSVTWLIGSGGAFSGVLDWSVPQSAATAAQSAINAGGNVSWFERQYTQYSNGTNSQYVSGGSFSGVTAGTAFLSVTPGWQTSGPINGGGVAQSWNATVTFTHASSPATDGGDASAFGYTFPGGHGGPAPFVPTIYNLPVTPGASYNIIIPPGGQITMVYYE